MVYESDFYTTRRPYRSTPGYSTYTVSTWPSRQIRILPGIGKVHVIHTYDRIVPYVGHKRLTVVTLPPKVYYPTLESTLQREYDRIENKLRPWTGYSPTSRYLNSHSYVLFDDERRFIRGQVASLLKQIHLPVPRVRNTSIVPLNRYGVYSSLPVRFSNDTYIHKLLTVSPNAKIHYATYYTEPVKKYIGQGHLSCVWYTRDKSYNRRKPLSIYEDAIRNDIHLLSYYINKIRQDKGQKEIKAPLSSIRPSRIFSVHKPIEDNTEEKKKQEAERAARLAKIYEKDDKALNSIENRIYAGRLIREETLLAEKRAIVEEQNRRAADQNEEFIKKPDIKRKEKEAKGASEQTNVDFEKEKARQEEEKRLAAEAVAEQERKKREAEEQKRLEEEQKRLEEEKRKQAEAEEERKKQEEQQRLEAEAKAEAERQEQLRLEEERKRVEEEQRKQEEERKKQEEQKRLEEEERKRLEAEAEAEEKRKQLLRLEEIARQAEEEKEAELTRQAEELVRLAEQEAESAKLEEPKAEDEVEEAENVKEESVEAEIVEAQNESNKEENEAPEEITKEENQNGETAEIVDNSAEEAVNGLPAEPTEENIETEIKTKAIEPEVENPNEELAANEE